MAKGNWRKRLEEQEIVDEEVLDPTTSEVEEVLTPAQKAQRAKEIRAAQKAEEQRIFETEGDLQDIWARRIANPDDFGTADEIHIKYSGFKLRWVNNEMAGRYQRVRNMGYRPVEKDELVDPREIAGVSYTSELSGKAFVCRGEKQKEILMKIPKAIWQEIEKSKVAKRRESYAQLKRSIQEAGVKEHTDKYGSAKGDQAADLVSSFRGNISFGTEQVGIEDI